MEWVWGVGLLVALVVGIGAGLLIARRRPAVPDPPGDASAAPAQKGRAIDTDAERQTGKHGLKGIGRKSLDSLRVGVVVLDADDEPVLVNPAARAMGLLRSGGAPGTIAADALVAAVDAPSDDAYLRLAGACGDPPPLAVPYVVRSVRLSPPAAGRIPDPPGTEMP